MSLMSLVTWRNVETQAIVDSNLEWETVANITLIEIFKQEDPAANTIIAAWVATLAHPQDDRQVMAFEDRGVWRGQNAFISNELKASGCKYGALGAKIPSFLLQTFLTQFLRFSKGCKKGWGICPYVEAVTMF
jgi:hypothetical protein